MKKFFAIIATVALMVTTAAITSSCQKDIAVAKSLIGTKWVCENQTGTESYVLTFTSQTECQLVYNQQKQIKGVYIITGSKGSLAGSTISVTPLEGQNYETKTITGVFESDKKLVLDGMIFNRSLLN